jgi:RNase P subunit RPR2
MNAETSPIPTCPQCEAMHPSLIYTLRTRCGSLQTSIYWTCDTCGWLSPVRNNFEDAYHDAKWQKPAQPEPAR